MAERVEPRTLQGTMELLPPDQILFNRMYDTIRGVYESFGFLPLDTPVLEYASVLLAKAGGETEKQIYRFTKGDADLAMRFDLTVPLARYVAQHKADLVFPFKRYQMSKVYRGERPQKGRFREFYQCDIDIIGAESLDLMYDAEMPAVIYNVFTKLAFGDFVIRINNRKVLNGFFASLGFADKIGDILRTIDKLEKIGAEKVRAELAEFGVVGEAADKILAFIGIGGSNDAVLAALRALDCGDAAFREGVEELDKVVHYAYLYGIPEKNIAIDLTIARGLDYYTGTVYETKLVDYPTLGSVCSGGRYDNLTDYYTDDHMPGIGISIGLTRLFSQLRAAEIITDTKKSLCDVLFVPTDKAHMDFVLGSAAEMRAAGLNVDVYCLDKGMKPKMKFANRSGIPYVALVGEDEAAAGKLTLKNMETGEQELLDVYAAIEKIKLLVDV